LEQAAVFVDAGYFMLPAGRFVADNLKLRREDIRLANPQLFIDALMRMIDEQFGDRVLRCYWYDAAAEDQPSRPTSFKAAMMDVAVSRNSNVSVVKK